MFGLVLIPYDLTLFPKVSVHVLSKQNRPVQGSEGITGRWTGLENGMENGTENGLVEDLTVICLSR